MTHTWSVRYVLVLALLAGLVPGAAWAQSGGTISGTVRVARTSQPLSGAQVYLDIQNVFDEKPPFFNGNTSGILGGAWGFNGFTSNPIGRLVSVGLRAEF